MFHQHNTGCTGFRASCQHCAAMRYHAVPSLAIAQFLADEDAVMAAKRLNAAAVFGVLVTFWSVTVLLAFIAHAPVNVQTRNTLPAAPPPRGPHSSGPRSRFPASTWRTTLPIRSAAGLVNVTRCVPAAAPSGFFAMRHQ